MERYVTLRKWLFFFSVPRIVPLYQASKKRRDFVGICLIFTVFRVGITFDIMGILIKNVGEILNLADVL